MIDKGEDIEVKDKLTLAELVLLKSQSFGRLSYRLHASGNIADVSWRNYELDNEGLRVRSIVKITKYNQKGKPYQATQSKTTSPYKMLDRQHKEVLVIS